MIKKIKHFLLKKLSRKYKQNEKRKEAAKHNFDFDYEKEQLIYDYLYLRELKTKEEKRLKKYNIIKNDTKKISYTTYKEWAEYVKSKYSVYSKDSLNEFIRFLKHRKRINNSYYNLIMAYALPILVTICINYFSEFFNESYNIFTNLLICIIILFYFFKNITLKVKELTDGADLQKGLYEDYIEIIEEIINEKNEI